MRLLALIALLLPAPLLPAAEDSLDPAPARAGTTTEPPTVALLKTQASTPLLENQMADFDALFFAEMAARPDLLLVEREELGAALDELHLSSSAAASSATAAKIGQWTGAKIIVSARGVISGKGMLVAARVIGTETGRVQTVSATMPAPDRFAAGANELAGKIAALLVSPSSDLVAPDEDDDARIASLRRLMQGRPLPPVTLVCDERKELPDAAASVVAGEIRRTLEALGGQVSPDPDARPDARRVIAAARVTAGLRHGDFFSARAHVTLRVVNAAGRPLVRDSQTELAADPTGAGASDAALQKAARALADRLVPALLQPAP